MSALIVIAHADSVVMLTAGAFLFGFGIGICSPTIYAWTIDLSDENHRGRGIATMYIALEIGIGMGALISGLVYQNDISNVPTIFYLSTLLVLAGFVYLFTHQVNSVSMTNPK